MLTGSPLPPFGIELLPPPPRGTAAILPAPPPLTGPDAVCALPSLRTSSLRVLFRALSYDITSGQYLQKRYFIFCHLRFLYSPVLFLAIEIPLETLEFLRRSMQLLLDLDILVQLLLELLCRSCQVTTVGLRHAQAVLGVAQLGVGLMERLAARLQLAFKPFAVGLCLCVCVCVCGLA